LHEVADVDQKLLILASFEGLAGLVVLVKLRLDCVALVEQCLVLGPVLDDKFAEGAPEMIGVNARAWGNL